MAESSNKEGSAIPAMREGDLIQVVAAASQAQAEKVRIIMDRLERVSELDRQRIQNISDLLKAAKADGGCGIGCW